MPPAPNTDGLPIWLQIVVSLVFVSITAFMAFMGYRRRVDREPFGAVGTVLASIPDMSAVRQLNDTCRVLCEHVERLDQTLRDHTHYLRNKIDVDADLSQRIRELTDEIIRSERQRSRRDRLERRVPPTPPV